MSIKSHPSDKASCNVLPLLSALVIAFVGLALSGCAAKALRGQAQTDTEVPGERSYSIREEVKLNAALRQDFEHAVQLLQAEQYEQGIELLTRVVANPQAQNNSAPYIDLAIAYQKTGRLERPRKT